MNSKYAPVSCLERETLYLSNLLIFRNVSYGFFRDFSGKVDKDRLSGIQIIAPRPIMKDKKTILEFGQESENIALLRKVYTC